MANKKFSEFDVSSDIVDVTELVGLNGASNIKITPTNLLADNTQAIADETSARISADSDLANDIGQEASDRFSADFDLQNQITSEVTAREDADTVLQNNLNLVSDAVANAVSRSEANIPTGYARLDNGAYIENAQINPYITDKTSIQSFIFYSTYFTKTAYQPPSFQGGIMSLYNFGSSQQSGMLMVEDGSQTVFCNFVIDNSELRLSALTGELSSLTLQASGTTLQVRNLSSVGFTNTYNLKFLTLR